MADIDKIVILAKTCLRAIQEESSSRSRSLSVDEVNLFTEKLGQLLFEWKKEEANAFPEGRQVKFDATPNP